jgi:hypothetical protein
MVAVMGNLVLVKPGVLGTSKPNTNSLQVFVNMPGVGHGDSYQPLILDCQDGWLHLCAGRGQNPESFDRDDLMHFKESYAHRFEMQARAYR